MLFSWNIPPSPSPTESKRLFYTSVSLMSPALAGGLFTTSATWRAVAQLVKNLPAMWDTWVRSLGQEDPLEKEMATHFNSSTLAWKIPWTEEPGRLQSMGSLRVGQDWAASLSLFTCIHWRRTWQPTPVLLSGESQGWGSLVGCHLWGRTESATTEVT